MTEFQQGIVQRATDLALRQRIASAFARGAAGYDEHADLQRSVADALLAQVPVQDVGTVLDLGCGTGYCAAHLRAMLPEADVLALDLVPAMLQQARQRAGAAGVTLLCGTADALPLQDGSLDLVVSSLALQWCSDPATAFAELQRVLRPGGLALVTTLGPATLQELRAAWTAVDGAPQGNTFVPATRLLQAAQTAGLHATLTTKVRWRHYDSLPHLARELKGLGANTVRAGKAASPAQFKAAAQAFAQARRPQGIPVQWEIFTLALRKETP